MYDRLTLRPSQVLCLICGLGKKPSGLEDPQLLKILETIEKNPDIPVTLCCNAGDIFSFQNTGERQPFIERKRDLDILQKIDLVPGITLPARILVIRILNKIKSLKGICIIDGKPACQDAEKRYYEKSRKLQLSLIVQYCNEYSKSYLAQRAKNQGIRIIIPPRTVDDLEKSKRDSLQAMYEAKYRGIRVRPHLFLCSVCQFGSEVKPTQAYDNLPELLQLVIKEKDVKITLVEGADWMMCAPCPSWTKENYCVHSLGKCGLSNQLRDMRVLQKLGIDYGTTIEARRLYKMILDKIPSTLEICRFDNPSNSLWHSGCGKRKTNSPDYVKGREKLMEILGKT
ncbi:MAG: DUF1284 domain-containing protein [Candidatus Omnitrophica bacterium]|nr:DUF1284 domain-containing protein [Candidatus Omnitrophota bacterium]